MSDAGKLGNVKSAPAQLAAFQTRIALYEAIPKRCMGCDSPLPYNKRHHEFCNRSCSASYHNRDRIRSPIECRKCHTLFKSESPSARFCSSPCAADYRGPGNTAKWLAGKCEGGTWRGVSTFVKRWLIESYGNRCCLCGWCEINKKSDKVPVQVDHIDGDPENHRPENLRLLCPNCHSLTPNYGALNRGNGRSKRYAGKSQLM